MSSRLVLPASLALASVLLVACSSDGSEPDTDAAETTSTEEATTTTSIPAPETASLTAEEEVGAAYRQGVARTDDGWIFCTNLALYRTDDAFGRVVEDLSAIPDDLAAEGFDHIGDGDVADGVLVVPLEQPDYDARRQMMVEYDPETLEVIGWTEVDQAHNAWVSVADGIAYSNSEFAGDDVIVRYDADTWEPLEPISLSTTVERVQGGDVLGGYLWLSTDDEGGDGIYRVSLADGEVVRVGALAHPDGEGEGIDATELDSGDLHALSIDVALAPVWFQHFALEP